MLSSVMKYCYLTTALLLIKELTFLANIQVYFAEFPYLHFSITP